MSVIDFPIEKINEFLKKYSFEVGAPLGSNIDNNEKTMATIKIKLTGVREMFLTGTKKDFIEYTIYLEDVNNEIADKIYNLIFDSLKTNDYHISNTDTTFFTLTVKVNQILKNFLKYWSIDSYVTCTRIVNNLNSKNQNFFSKPITEGLIVENVYDNVTKNLVKDVLSVFKYQKEGEYGLPEDINGNMVYEFPEINSEFTINLTMEMSDEIETVDVDGAYYPEEDVIEISIISNPNFDRELLEELYYELNELIRHELEHIKQYNRGDEIPKKEPKKPLKYYSQKHELEAQIAGFKRRAKKERKPLENVIRDWFKK